jgi:hypothetical protein
MIRSLYVAAATVALFVGTAAFADAPWSLAKESDGIKIYVREVPGSRLREFRGEIELTTDGERVVEVLQDAESFRKWMPDVVTSDLLQLTATEQFHYVENAAPWPVAHRDGVYHFTYSRSEDTGAAVTTVKVEAVPNHVPAVKGKVRIPRADGYWKLVPTSTGVAVTFQMHADPGGAIPSWLANQTVVDTPFKTLQALRQYVQASRPDGLRPRSSPR